MFEEFHPASRTRIIRDSQRIPRNLIHERNFVSSARTPHVAAQEYLRSFYRLIEAKAEELKNLHLPPESDLTDAGVEYRFISDKRQFDTTTVSYQQTFFGLPVWEAGLAIHMQHPKDAKPPKDGQFRIFGAQATRHPEIKARKPSARALARLQEIDGATLAKLVGGNGKRIGLDASSLTILHRRLMIYRYEESKRFIPLGAGTGRKGKAVASRGSTFSLPPVGRGIKEGRHYVVAALDFRLDTQPFGPLHWVALVEATTLSILYMRALIDDVCGLVFRVDPVTAAGGPLPAAGNRALNPRRRSVTLRGLRAPVGGKHALNGKFVRIEDFEPPKAKPPTKRKGKNFDYQARTNNFAGVNAYYHCDRFFRLVENLGFPRASYFKATKFPVPVDHRGRFQTPNGIEVNGHCEGNSTATGGLRNVRFCLADLGDTANPIGVACDWRVVLHELGGHGTLWNHINTGLFKFAHSAGDSFAAILNDPDTELEGKRRFVTFPWLIKDVHRRHDREVAKGWAWGGTKDLGVSSGTADPKGYQSEQILSTTHFRIYRAIGGDSNEPSMRRFASRFMAYLILRTIGSLHHAHPPHHVRDFAAALMFADDGKWTSEGHAGGAYGKVIRWAFEKQGLYQPPGAPKPVTREGAPPPVDVYIDDGREGEYVYKRNYWSSEAIWNRREDDRGTSHQEPVPGVTNFAFVKIKNRGTRRATAVTVKAFHSRPSAGLSYPDDWRSMSTAKLSAPDVPPDSAREITVGPFAWHPSSRHDCMLMVASAHGDLSNVSRLHQGDAIPDWRLVPHDNNIGQRNLFAVDATGSKALLAVMNGRRIHVKNPHAKRARMVIKPILPSLLANRGWRLEFDSASGRTFSLEPGAARDVVMRLKAGEEFTAEEVEKVQHPAIHVEIYAGGILVGGMSYRLDARMEAPASRSC